MELLDFNKIWGFPPISLDGLSAGDPMWALNVSRQRDGLFSESEKTSADWLVRVAEFYHDTGTYLDAIQHANRGLTLAEAAGNYRLMARALAAQCSAELSIFEVKMGRAHLEQLERLAVQTQDPFVLAASKYMRGAFAMFGDTEEPDALRKALGLFEDSAAIFESLQDHNRAIRSRIDNADAMSRMGDYIPAILEVERAMAMAAEHGCWKFAGRLLLTAATAAMDQGYREGLEDALRKGLRWCDFTGDYWGRVHCLFAIGRLKAYEMPIGIPSRAAGPAKYFREAIDEAEHHGAVSVVTQIESSMAWMFQKAGADDRSRELLSHSRYDEDELRVLLEDCVSHTSLVTRSMSVRISARMQDGIEDSPDAFLIFDARRDRKGQCVDFINEYRNGAATKIFGLGPGYVLMFSEARRQEYFTGLVTPLFEAIEHRITYQDDWQIGSGETSLWYRRRIVPSGDGAAVTLRDVTAEHRIEEALRKAAESAEASDRAKSEFLANMSHEIRTPIHGVLGLARLLSETELDPVQRSYIEDVIGSGDILLNVIGAILDLSKIESNSMSIDLAPVNLSEAVISTARLYQGQAKEKGLALRCEIDSSIPRVVLADGVRLKQVLANLIGNAMKFTAQGSVTVSASAEEEFIAIEVRDTGIGVPSERLEAIFDRFQQATVESRMFGGTGLGLTLSRGLVELMGGTIRAYSQPGEGSRFVVRLPLVETEEVAPNLPVALPIRFDGRRVLLVDDNRVNTIVAKYALEKLGCEVTLASDGAEALDTMDSAAFDLVFMDVRMPGMNGLEATRERRRREESGLARYTIVALTAGALLEEREDCFRAGMDDYISKPFAGDSLREVLARWLS